MNRYRLIKEDISGQERDTIYTIKLDYGIDLAINPENLTEGQKFFYEKETNLENFTENQNKSKEDAEAELKEKITSAKESPVVKVLLSFESFDKLYEYYSALGENEKQKIPKEIKELIRKVKQLSGSVEVKPQSDDLENKWIVDKNFKLNSFEPYTNLKHEEKKELLTNVYLNERGDFHPERNSLVHIKIVCSRAEEFGDEDLKQVAILHDLKKWEKVTIGTTGFPSSPGHDTAGGSLTTDPIVKYICNKHMAIKSWNGTGEGSKDKLGDKTRFDLFQEAPGADNNEKAKVFWKLVVFTKMDDMNLDFKPEELKWDNPTFDKWDEECPLRNEYKSGEMVKKVEAKPVSPFTSPEIMKFGAKNQQIGQINKAIVGKSREEALEIIVNIVGPFTTTQLKNYGIEYSKMIDIIEKILGKSREEAFQIIKDISENQDLKMESRKWIMTYESFRKFK
jgi:hypothetical protein